jgi:hypothetical protein
VCAAAAVGGHLEIVQFVVREDYECSRNAWILNNAVAGNNLELVRWLLEWGWKWTHETTRYAVIHKQPEMIQFAKERQKEILELEEKRRNGIWW